MHEQLIVQVILTSDLEAFLKQTTKPDWFGMFLLVIEKKKATLPGRNLILDISQARNMKEECRILEQHFRKHSHANTWHSLTQQNNGQLFTSPLWFESLAQSFLETFRVFL